MKSVHECHVTQLKNQDQDCTPIFKGEGGSGGRKARAKESRLNQSTDFKIHLRLREKQFSDVEPFFIARAQNTWSTVSNPVLKLPLSPIQCWNAIRNGFTNQAHIEPGPHCTGVEGLMTILIPFVDDIYHTDLQYLKNSN